MAFSEVARRALEICHFDPTSGEDLGKAPGAKERCEAACYDCLLSYTNQPEHPMLDRRRVVDVLRALTRAAVSSSPTALTREQQVERLMRLAASDLERKLGASCQRPAKTLADGRKRAARLADPSEQAWAMRDTFDGLLDVIRRHGTQNGKPPPQPLPSAPKRDTPRRKN